MSVSSPAATRASAPDHLVAMAAPNATPAANRQGRQSGDGARHVGAGPGRGAPSGSGARVDLRLGGQRRPPVDPAPVQHQEQEAGRDPEADEAVQEPGSRQHEAQSLDRHQQSGDRRPQRAAEQQIGEQRDPHHRERADGRGGDAPAEGLVAERVLAQADHPLAERGVRPRADVPLVVTPEPLGRAVDVALGVRAADQDAAGLGVVDLVEDTVRRGGEVPEAEGAGQQTDGEDRHDGTVEEVRESGHRLRVSVATRSGGTGGPRATGATASDGPRDAPRTGSPGRRR